MKNKLILDFDGVFSADMLYTTEGKAMKSFPWGIRHSIDLLVQHGFEIYIITGDSTDFGKKISAKFTHNLNVKDIYFVKSHDKLTFLRDKFDLSECIYCGDDIYDIEIFKQTYGILPGGAHSIFQSFVDYISKYTTRDYFFMDMALHILRKFRYDDIDEKTFSEYIAKDSGKRPFNKMLLDKRYNNIFILQQYSMRNHSDGLYNPLLDGNLNLTLHRIYPVLQADKNKKVTLTIPLNVDLEQLKILEQFIANIGLERQVSFAEITYGKNALANRDQFIDISHLKGLYTGCDLIISDFSSCIFNGTIPVIYNFNISKSKDLDRWFIDEFFDKQMNTVIECDEYVYVLNDSQREFMLDSATSPIIRKNIESTVIVDTEIINKELFDHQLTFFGKMMTKRYEDELKDSLKTIWLKYEQVFFLPFRLTDTCYNFKGILEICKDSKMKICIITTNPNDGDLLSNVPDNVRVINAAEKFGNINKKTLYYEILKNIEEINTITDRPKIYIPIFEDPSIVLHQSLIEMQLACPSGVNFINEFNSPTIETLSQKMNNNYITKLTY